MLPDLLEPDLKIVFCGTAAGDKSALRKLYYAGPGNKFYSILYRSGLTPVQLLPEHYPSLLLNKIGLTDLVKGKSGMDHKWKDNDYDVKSFIAKINKYKPSVVCFNGKEAARAYFGLRNTSQVQYGLQEQLLGKVRFFVAPSTSGAANGSWDDKHWFELAELLKKK